MGSGIVSKKLKMSIGIVVILGAIALLIVTGMNSSTGFQVSVSDLAEKGQKYDQNYLLVEGTVLPETIIWNSADIEVEFVVTDGENQLTVFYNDVVPDNLDYEEGVEAILRGRYDYSTALFYAETVETRCPSKYEIEEE